MDFAAGTRPTVARACKITAVSTRLRSSQPIYIPALNSGASHVAALTELILRHGQGWPEFDPAWDGARVAAQRATARSRQERMRDASR